MIIFGNCLIHLPFGRDDVVKYARHFENIFNHYSSYFALFYAGFYYSFFNIEKSRSYFFQYFSKYPQKLFDQHFNIYFTNQRDIIESFYFEILHANMDKFDAQLINVPIIPPNNNQFEQYRHHVIIHQNLHPLMGDTYMVARIMHHIKQKNNSPILFITPNKYLVNFLQCFPSIDKVLASENCQELLYHYPWSLQPQIGHVYHLKLKQHIERKSLQHQYINKLGLNEEEQLFEKMHISNDDKLLISEFINSWAHEKIIFINTDSISHPINFGNDIWVDMANKFQNLGYLCIFNDNMGRYNPHLSFYPPIYLIAEFAQYCRLVISVRSGFCDVIAGEKPNIPILVLSPNSTFENDVFDLQNNFNKANTININIENIHDIQYVIEQSLALIQNRNDS